jgi:hypothetical protein
MKTEMSPRAVTMRLKKTSELRSLCIALGGERLRSKLLSSGFLPVSEGTSGEPVPLDDRFVGASRNQ